MLKNSKDIIYIKPIEVTLGCNVSIKDNLGNDFITELSSEEYDKLEQEYGEYDQKEEKYVLNDKEYEGFEVGFIEYSESITHYSLFFNYRLAYDAVYKNVIESIANNKLTIFFDYENITFKKHHLMFKNEEIYQKLVDLFNNSFINLQPERRYLLKIEGILDKNNINILKWELSRIESIDFKTNSWSNWNSNSWFGYVRYENEELILVDGNGELISNNNYN